MFLGIYYNLSIWYKLSDNNNKGAQIAVMGAVITLVLNFIFIPIYGYTAAAWATFICYFSMMVVCYLMGKKYYPITYNIKKFVGYTLFAVSLFAVHQLLLGFQTNLSILYFIRVVLFLSFFALVYFIENKFKNTIEPL
jgi:O-antigen/teichoic acid export membrane protein